VARFHPITNPTPKGSRSPRNFLQAKFLTALAEDFERDGAAAIKICRIEEPAQYVKIVASLMPKEFAVTDNALVICRTTSWGSCSHAHRRCSKLLT
jgi:hypothetical protein